MTAPLMPGATSISALTVYTETAPDGLAGGSPHLHTVATEAYLVIAGVGELHSIDATGWRSTPLEPGVTVWFEAGVIHRAVNGGGLEMRVVMSHAGLPEAGDAVLTFPDQVLADPRRYAAAAALPGPGAPHRERRDAALRRRDLAVAGYRALLPGGERGPVDREALSRLHDRAAALVAPRLEDWEAIAEATVARTARDTARSLAALAAHDVTALAAGRIAVAAGVPAFGMCGTLIKDRQEGPS